MLAFCFTPLDNKLYNIFLEIVWKTVLFKEKNRANQGIETFFKTVLSKSVLIESVLFKESLYLLPPD